MTTSPNTATTANPISAATTSLTRRGRDIEAYLGSTTSSVRVSIRSEYHVGIGPCLTPRPGPGRETVSSPTLDAI